MRSFGAVSSGAYPPFPMAGECGCGSIDSGVELGTTFVECGQMLSLERLNAPELRSQALPVVVTVRKGIARCQLSRILPSEHYAQSVMEPWVGTIAAEVTRP